MILKPKALKAAAYVVLVKLNIFWKEISRWIQKTKF